MREVKEKSPLKERAAKTIKSAPQAAFRRGTDASFQQLLPKLLKGSIRAAAERCLRRGFEGFGGSLFQR